MIEVALYVQLTYKCTWIMFKFNTRHEQLVTTIRDNTGYNGKELHQESKTNMIAKHIDFMFYIMEKKKRKTLQK